MRSLNAEVVLSRRAPALETRPTVFVVDDDVSIRESLGRLIQWAGWDAEAFGSAREFLSYQRPARPSCLVLDAGLPERNGLDLQRHLADVDTHLSIIVTTGHRDIPMTVQAMKAGAVDVLTKPFVDEDLLNAIRLAILRSEASRRREAEVQTLRRYYSLLTAREQQVMGLVVSGLLNKQTGGELSISETTVKAHRGQVMRKMKAGSLPDLVRMAVQLELPLAAKH